MINEQLASTMPSLSIIIPTLNEEGYIDKVLNDICEQRIDDQIEIIVSDSGSVDETESIVKNFIKNHPGINIRFIRASRKGVAIARNKGAKQAKGEYIVFLDADSRIPINFLSNAIREMKERNLDAGGCYLQPDTDKLVDKIVFFISNRLVLNALQYTKRPCSAGAGIIAKKETHEKIDGFDHRFKYCEDFDYIKRISESGTFRMLKSTNIVFNTRRFDLEGRSKVWFRYSIASLCYLFNIKNIEIEYEFGKFSKGNSNLKGKWQ